MSLPKNGTLLDPRYLAVWLALKLKDDTAKLILIFWCLFAFIGAGFEYSVANMTLLGVSLLLPHAETISWIGFSHKQTDASASPIYIGVACT